MNILELQTEIRKFLLTKTDRVYFYRAPEDAVFPYVVFNLPNSNMLETREDFVLEIDIWDRNKDTTVLETLTGNIDGNSHILNPTGIDRLLIKTNTLSIKFYKENRLVLEDSDKQINRRQLRYIVQTYF